MSHTARAVMKKTTVGGFNCALVLEKCMRNRYLNLPATLFTWAEVVVVWGLWCGGGCFGFP